MTGRSHVGARLIGFLVALLPLAAQAQGEFYAGKTVKLQIGSSAGGGSDAWGRLIARYLGKYLPGKPTVVVENVPGAGSLRLTNQIYNVAPRDGTVIGMINRGIPFEPLLGGKNIQFNALKMNYIGSPSIDTAVCAARKDAAVKTAEDLFTKALAVGATGAGADSATYPRILSRLLGMKFKIITGYPGSNDFFLALQRNEIQGVCGVSYDALANRPLAREGKLNILFQASLAGDPQLKGTPLVSEFAKSKKRRQALALFLVRASIGRPIIAPPGVPASRVALLRQAVAKTLSDPELVKMAKIEHLRIRFTSGAKIKQIVSAAYKTPAAIVRVTAEALGNVK